jgi:hypothetical protein
MQPIEVDYKMVGHLVSSRSHLTLSRPFQRLVSLQCQMVNARIIQNSSHVVAVASHKVRMAAASLNRAGMVATLGGA